MQVTHTNVPSVLNKGRLSWKRVKFPETKPPEKMAVCDRVFTRKERRCRSERLYRKLRSEPI